MGQFPEAAGIQGALQGAASLLAQAYDLRVRAYAIKDEIAQRALMDIATLARAGAALR